MNNKKISLPRTPAEWLEAVMNFIFFLCGILAVGCVLLISVYMVLSGVPAIQKIGLFRFLFGTRWASTAADPAYGILPFILSSVYGTLGATVIGVPIGLLTAVFLSKAAGPKVRTVVVTAIELLSGIPSVVFGLLGMQVLVPAVAKTFGKASGACLLSAIVVLAVMILPSIVSVSVTALNAVPPEYEQGSLALGATDTETWFKISIPAAKSGIAAGIVLGIGLSDRCRQRIGYRLGLGRRCRQGLRFGLLFSLHVLGRGLRSGFCRFRMFCLPLAPQCRGLLLHSLVRTLQHLLTWCFASIGVGSHTHQSPGFIQFHRRHIVRKRRLKT